MKNKYILVILLFLILVLIVSKEQNGRPKHCIKDKCVDESVFANLPEYPSDFSRDIDSEENSWRQPEFYSTWESEGLPYYINPVSGYLGVQGYGIYPSEIVVNTKPNIDTETIFYVHSSWYIINYQGVRLVANYNRSIMEIDINPESLLLEPTYPVFNYNWTQKIKLKIRTKDAPKGDYTVTIDIAAPPNNFSERWATKYPNRYVDAGSIGIGKPFSTLFVRVQ